MVRRRGDERSWDRGNDLSTRLRAIVAGTAEFSVPTLRATADVADVIAVVTQPDRPGDRGRPAPRPVADIADQLGIAVLQPERIRTPEVVDQILALGADVLVVAAYGQILPQRLLDGFRLGGVNVHASLLPRWRGAAPINAAIVHGDATTGVSIMRMEAGLDTGPVYAKHEIALTPTTTSMTLTRDLAELGASALADVLVALDAGAIAAVAQPDEGVTVAPRLTRADGDVDPLQHTAIEIDRRVRGLRPWPGVTAMLAGQSVRLLVGAVADRGVAAGEAGPLVPGELRGNRDDTVDLVTADGSVFRIAEVQAPGGRPMTAGAWARGRRIGRV